LIAFLDDDAVADLGCLGALRAISERPGVLGAMGRIEPLRPGYSPRWFPKEFLWVLGCTYRGLPETVGPVRNLYGCMAFRREVLDRIGIFNPSVGRTDLAFPWSCEDTELCMRARKLIAAVEFMFVPKALVWHKIPATRLRFRYFCIPSCAEGMSKAYVSALRASSDTVSAERRYVLGVLTRGILQSLGDAISRFDPGGIARASAITIGLAPRNCRLHRRQAEIGLSWGANDQELEPISPVAER
jgi:hypothetical protein